MSNKADKDSFTSSTVATTVVQSKDGTKIIKNTSVAPSGPGKPLAVTTSTRNESSNVLPRRTPIEEASLPQPRPAGVVDTSDRNEGPHLLDSMAEKLSRAVHSVKEGAEGVSEKLKSVGATVAQKTDEATAAAARTTANVVTAASKPASTMDDISKRSEKRAQEWSERAMEHDAQAQEHYLRAKQPFNYSDGTRPAKWTDEDESILLRIRRDIQEDQQKQTAPSSRYQSDSWAQPPAQQQNQQSQRHQQHQQDHHDEHHGTLQTIKDWFTGSWSHEDHDKSAAELSNVSMGGWRSPTDKELGDSWRDFDEGADMAKREAFRRLQRIARDTESKIDAARRSADVWDREAREQVLDAWENARTHSQQLLRNAEKAQAATHSKDQPQMPLTGSALVHSLQQIKQENSRLKTLYMRDLCERHPDRGQCYDSMKRIMGLAKENTRIKVALADKNLKSH